MNDDKSAANDPEEITEELYANSFWHFVSDLRKLTLNAKAQCEANQFDNVAWEIQYFFVGSAEGILTICGGNLSDRQKAGIAGLIKTVSAIPGSVICIAATNSRDDHLRAMSQPCWAPIREQASQVLAMLEPEIARTRSILWPPH